MASSGTLEGYFSGGTNPSVFTFYCHWVQVKNETENSSTINLSYQVLCSGSNYQTWRYMAPFKLFFDNQSDPIDNGQQVNFNCYDGAGHGKVVIDNTNGISFSTDYLGYDLPSITVNHNNDGTRSVPIRVELYLGSEGSAGTGVIQGVINLDTLIGKCTAPTSVSVSKATIAPGSVTVSWSGASAGNNNSISKYRLFYKTGSAPTISDYTGFFDTTNTNYAPNILTSRGTTYYFKVQTIGTVSGYDSDISSAQATCLVNTLPESPTFDKPNQTITSTANPVEITVTADSDSGGGNKREVYYNTSNSHLGQSKLVLDNNYQGKITFNPSPGRSIQYYFWTWDGIEYSSYSYRNIKRNLKPAFNTVTFTPTGYLADGQAASTNTYVSNVAINATINKPCNITVAIDYSLYSGMSPYSSITVVTTSGSNYSNTININHELASIANQSNYKNKRIYFRVCIKADDTLYESSGWSSSSVWSIASAPTSIITYDQFSDSNIVTGKFWERIRIKYLEDESMTTQTVAATSSNTSYTIVSMTTSTNGNYRYLDITLPSSISGGTKITLTVTLTDNDISKTFTIQRTKILSPTVNGDVTVENGTLNMYNLPQSVTLSCTAGGVTFTNSQLDTNTNYHLASMTITVARDNNGTNVRTVTISTATKTDSGATAQFTVAASDNFVKFGDWNKSSYNGTSTGYVRITFTNKYGATFSAGYSQFSINYDRAPALNSFKLQYSLDNNTWTDLATASTSGTVTSTSKLQEGLYVRAAIGYTAYSANAFTIILQHNNAGGSSYIEDNRFVVPAINRTTATRETIYINYGNPTKIGEITDTNNRIWRINFNGSIYGGTITTEVYQHTSAILTFQESNPPYTRNGNTTTFKLNSITVSDDGTNASIETGYPKYYICDINNNRISAAFTNTSEISIDYNGTDTWAQKNIKVECEVKITGTLNNTIKSGYSTNTCIIYTDQPTIAYRPNRLGINTKTPDSTAVLDIYTQSEINFINLHDGSNGMIQLNLLNHTIDII